MSNGFETLLWRQAGLSSDFERAEALRAVNSGDFERAEAPSVVDSSVLWGHPGMARAVGLRSPKQNLLID